MMKFEIQADINGKILNVSKSYKGTVHAFKIRQMSEHVLRNALVLADDIKEWKKFILKEPVKNFV